MAPNGNCGNCVIHLRPQWQKNGKKISSLLVENGFKINNIDEKVHIVMGLVDNLCHEIVYHKHEELDYDIMTDVVIQEVVNILKQD